MSLLSRNVDLGAPLKISSWRKVAIGTWRTAGDPSVYGLIEADVGPTLKFLEELSAKHGVKFTLTHFIGRACAEVFRRHPQINSILRFGRLYPRKHVDIFFQVASDSHGHDLSGLTIRQADGKSLVEIAREMQNKAEAIRTRGDPGFRKMKKMMGLMPGFVVGPLVNLTGFIMYSLNVWSSLFGTPKDPFGSAMITSVGSLGIDMAYVPLVPYSRIPLLIAIGAAQERPIVKNGAIEIATICRLCITFDHRLIDGVHASHMIKTFNEILADPAGELA